MLYIIECCSVVDGVETIHFFGPFPTKERALKYSTALRNIESALIHTLTVPNCIQAKVEIVY